MSQLVRGLRPASAADTQMTAGLSARYGDSIRRYFARRLRGSPDIDDLAQEVFVRLLKRTRIDDIGNIQGYLFQIAANLLRERGRQRFQRRLDSQESFNEDSAAAREERSPERILMGKEACELLIRALQELPERTRAIFILNRYEDLAGVEIARRLGVSVSTVEKDMMRAIAHLRARLR